MLSADGHLAAVFSQATPNLLQLWYMTTTTFRQRNIMLGSNNRIYFDQTAFSPDDSMLAVVSAEGAKGGVLIFETENGREVASLRDNHSPVWSGNSRLLATSGPGLVGTENNGVSLGTIFEGGSKWESHFSMSGKLLHRRQPI